MHGACCYFEGINKGPLILIPDLKIDLMDLTSTG